MNLPTIPLSCSMGSFTPPPHPSSSPAPPSPACTSLHSSPPSSRSCISPAQPPSQPSSVKLRLQCRHLVTGKGTFFFLLLFFPTVPERCLRLHSIHTVAFPVYDHKGNDLPVIVVINRSHFIVVITVQFIPPFSGYWQPPPGSR